MQVSVIIPTYNYAEYIGRAIQSVREQQYPQERIEIIVVDDGSIDNTATLIKALQAEANIQYHYQPNSGKAMATQKGIELANGEIIFTLDADDWFLPGKIAATVAVFLAFQKVVHVASAARIVWQSKEQPSVREPLPAFLFEGPHKGLAILKYFYQRNLLFGGGSTFAAKASVLKKIPWHNAIDMYTDEWLVMQTLLQGDSFFLPQPYSVWWVHSKNYSGAGGEALAQKNERLKQSSQKILELLKQGSYPGWLQQAYQLKHSVRCLAWLEAEKKKRPTDAIHFLKTILLSGHYSPTMLHRYHAFNRLLKW